MFGPFPPDYGHELRTWMSTEVKEKLHGCVLLSEFNGLRECLITKEMALGFYKDSPNASVNERIHTLSEELKNGMNFLTGEYLVEKLFSLPMLSQDEMQKIEAKDCQFVREFANPTKADVDEIEMKRSEYTSKYSMCTYKYKSYDLRDLKRCTKFESRLKLENNMRIADTSPIDHMRNILADVFILRDEE